MWLDLISIAHDSSTRVWVPQIGRLLLLQTLTCDGLRPSRTWFWNRNHMGGPKGASHDHFLYHTGWPEMVYTRTTQMGWTWPFPMPYRSAGDGPYQYYINGPNMTISRAIQVGWRWSIPVLYQWAKHDHFLCHTGRPEMVHTGTIQMGQTWPFPMPYRSARDGPYWFYMDGPNMTISHAIQVSRRWSLPVLHGWPEHDHFPCHTGQPEMVPTCTTWVGQRVLLMTIPHATQVGRRWNITCMIFLRLPTNATMKLIDWLQTLRV
jgi:hypothetical protein